MMTPPTRRKIDLVVTTIYEPAWLQGYVDDLSSFDGRDDVTIHIVADRKTPPSVWGAAEQAARAGLDVRCPTLDQQTAFLERLGLPADYIPWNTDNRRNIGFLRAWEQGADVVISIDDDNFCRATDGFFDSHMVVGSRVGDVDAASAPAGWFNICSLLDMSTAAPVFPRGYPYAHRGGTTHSPAEVLPVDGTIAINAGLWLGDPDVDAITRLALRPEATAASPQSTLLGSATWTPINTQNTSLIGSALPAYYYVRMGFPLQGMRIDRYGDILSGYFLQACAKHLGDVTRVGTPVADHVRSHHNLMQDLYHELAGIVLIEDLTPWLQQVKLSGRTYPEAYESLTEALADAADGFRGFVWDEGGREFLRETAANMRIWLRTLRRVAGSTVA